MSGPHPEVAAQRLAVRAALADVAPGGVVLVACSGGADSLALAAATAFVAERSALRAGAVVVDHGLQTGSREVAHRAGEQCRGLGLDPVDVVRVEVPSGAGPEASARTARYTALEAGAQRHGAAAVLLGHTLDDQAETVLLGLARGSGARSLAGMPASRGVLRRPFLGLRRTGTAAACAALGLEPWHDPTNGPWPDPTDGPSPGGVADAERRTAGVPPAALAPLRSRVRHDVMPVLEAVLGPGAAVALARTAEELREDTDVLDGLAAQLLADARLDRGLDVAVLAAAPAGIRRRALHAALLAAGLPGGSLGRGHVLAVDALVVDWHGQGPLDLPGGTARRRCGRLTLTGR